MDINVVEYLILSEKIKLMHTTSFQKMETLQLFFFVIYIFCKYQFAKIRLYQKE